ncbi:MAG: guanylate kinase [Bacillota bacterium]|nr:guanylate kinase [Bacillota bacterium]
MGEGILFVISGPSGTGKGTVCRKLVERTGIHFSVSMTTRKPRPGEVEGKSYYFVSEETYSRVLEEKGFLEWANVHGNRYGTPREEVLKQLDRGRDVLLDIDVQGALQVKKNFPQAVLIFLLPPSMAELRRRITGRRSETPEAIAARMAAAMGEISRADQYDYCVINDKVEAAADRVEAIMKAEHSRVSDSVYELIEKYKKEERGEMSL